MSYIADRLGRHSSRLFLQYPKHELVQREQVAGDNGDETELQSDLGGDSIATIRQEQQSVHAGEILQDLERMLSYLGEKANLSFPGDSSFATTPQTAEERLGEQEGKPVGQGGHPLEDGSWMCPIFLRGLGAVLHYTSLRIHYL